MSIDFLTAIKIAQSNLESLEKEIGLELKLREELTIQNEWYYVFFYNSRIFIDKGDFSYALAGNAPFIVDRVQGAIYNTGTADDINSYLQKFEKNVLPLIMKTGDDS